MGMACRSIISPEKLPLTQRVDYFHWLRVYFQIMSWISLQETNQWDAANWGWVQKGGQCLPTKSDMDNGHCTPIVKECY